MFHVRKAGIETVYVEGKRATKEWRQTFGDLVEALAPGTVVAVSHLYVIADPSNPKQRRASLRANMAALEAKGTKTHPIVIWELSTGLHSDTRTSRDKMRDVANDKIAQAISGDEAGRPRLTFTDDERAVIDKHWFDMRLPKNDDAVPLIRRDARAARLERLYLISWQQIYHRVGASGRAKLKRKHE